MKLTRWGTFFLAFCFLLTSCLAESAWDQEEWAAVTAALSSDEPDPVPKERRILVKDSDLGDEWLEESWMNVLLLSTDSPDMTQNFGRADVAMICAVNLETGETHLLSLPQFALLSLEGAPEKVFLKYVNCFGGPMLVLKSVNEALELKLHRYCAINFQSFVKAVDLLDGVTLTLSDQEAQALELAPGENRLSGEQALRYTRLRQEGGAARPRKLLKAVLSEALSQNSIDRAFSVMESMISSLDTNLTTMDLMNLLFAVASTQEKADVTTGSLPDGLDAAAARAFLFGE